MIFYITISINGDDERHAWKTFAFDFGLYDTAMRFPRSRRWQYARVNGPQHISRRPMIYLARCAAYLYTLYRCCRFEVYIYNDFASRRCLRKEMSGLIYDFHATISRFVIYLICVAEPMTESATIRFDLSYMILLSHLLSALSLLLAIFITWGVIRGAMRDADKAAIHYAALTFCASFWFETKMIILDFLLYFLWYCLSRAYH